jgi:hypothetical protein
MSLLALLRFGIGRRVASGIVLAVLLGVAGGTALGAWAGARRTDTAYARLLEVAGTGDYGIDSLGEELGREIDFDALRRIDGVESVAEIAGYGFVAFEPDGSIDFDNGSFFFFSAGVDDVAYRQLERPHVLEGRLPDPGRPDEVLVNTVAADNGFGIGSTIHGCLFELDVAERMANELFSQEPTPELIDRVIAELCGDVSVHVVGVGRHESEIVITPVDEGTPAVIATPAFVASAPKAFSYQYGRVRLEPGTDRVAFVEAVNRSQPPDIRVQSFDGRLASVERSASPYVTALLLFAAVVAATSLAILAPALGQWSAPPGDDRAALLSLGVTGRQQRLLAMARGAAVGGMAAVAAGAIAIVSSRWFPVGPVRSAEPDPGIRVDGLVLTVGVLALPVLGAVIGVLGLGARSTQERRHPSRVAEALAGAGAGPSLVAGVRAATRGGRRQGATAGAMVGVGVAVLAVTSSLAFARGLDELLGDATRFGFVWDAQVEGFDSALDEDIVTTLIADDHVVGVAEGIRAALVVEGRSMPAFAVEHRKGRTDPVALDGRLPSAPNEVALAGQTLDRIDTSIGDTVVAIDENGERVPLQVVGRTLLPMVSLGDSLSVGEGALLTAEGLDSFGSSTRPFVLVDAEAGLDDTYVRGMLEDAELVERDTDAVLGPIRSGDLIGYDRVRRMPLYLACLLAVLGVAVLGHTLATSIRRQRHDLAVLKSLGFSRRNVSATVVWHAVALVVVCLAVGLPLGLATGRTLWRTFARGLGVVPDAGVPTTALLVVAGGALVLAVALALLPGRAAARIRPAVALRTE